MKGQGKEKEIVKIMPLTTTQLHREMTGITALMAIMHRLSFSMTAKKWEWEPGTITVNQGDRVRLNIKSVDVAHGILLPDFNVDVKFAAGESATAEFVATKKGAFTFRCNVFCGEGHSGMAGTLIVN